MDNRIASDQIVPERETLTVAFQQDFEDKASDGALIETVVGMANAEGGTLYIGVGEEGRIFGMRTEAGNNPEKAVAFIASHTVPPLIVSAESEEVEGKKIWVVRVPKAEGIVAAQDGKVLKRRLGVGKKPGTFPLYPPEFVSRLSDIGRLDFSAMILSGTSTDDLDDLEREGLRAFMRKNRAEKGLADLEDSEFDKALGFVRETRSGILPTVAGLLMIGKVTVIQRRLSGAGIMFQHFSGSVVRARNSSCRLCRGSRPCSTVSGHETRRANGWTGLFAWECRHTPSEPFAKPSSMLSATGITLARAPSR